MRAEKNSNHTTNDTPVGHVVYESLFNRASNARFNQCYNQSSSDHVNPVFQLSRSLALDCQCWPNIRRIILYGMQIYVNCNLCYMTCACFLTHSTADKMNPLASKIITILSFSFNALDNIVKDNTMIFGLEAWDSQNSIFALGYAIN